jgi:hypothetical protein
MRSRGRERAGERRDATGTAAADLLVAAQLRREAVTFVDTVRAA